MNEEVLTRVASTLLPGIAAVVKQAMEEAQTDHKQLISDFMADAVRREQEYRDQILGNAQTIAALRQEIAALKVRL